MNHTTRGARFRALSLLLGLLFAAHGCGWVIVGDVIDEATKGSTGDGAGPPTIVSVNLEPVGNVNRAADLGQVALNFTILGGGAPSGSLDIEFSRSPTGSELFFPATITALSVNGEAVSNFDLGSVPLGIGSNQIRVVWDADNDGFNGLASVALKITASRNGLGSNPIELFNVTIGNEPPTAGQVTVLSQDPQPDDDVDAFSGFIVVRYRLRDENRDPTEIDFAYSIDDGITYVPIPDADVVAGQLVDLLPDSAPINSATTVFDFVWDSTATLPDQDFANIRLSVQPRDNLPNGQGARAVTDPFVLLNNDPTQALVEELAFNPDSQGSVGVQFDLIDEQGDDTDVVIQFSRTVDGFPALGLELDDPITRRRILLDPLQRKLRNIVSARDQVLFVGRMLNAVTNDNQFQFQLGSLSNSTLPRISVPLDLLNPERLNRLRGYRLQLLNGSGGVQDERRIVNVDSVAGTITIEAPFSTTPTLGQRFNFLASVERTIFNRPSATGLGQSNTVPWDAPADVGLGDNASRYFIRVTPFSGIRRGESVSTSLGKEVLTDRLKLAQGQRVTADTNGQPLTASPQSLDLADLDGNGAIDLVLCDDNGVQVRSGQKQDLSLSLPFLQSSSVVLANPMSGPFDHVRLRDFDGDNITDLVALNEDELAFVFNQTGALLSGPNTVELRVALTTPTIGCAIADFNNSGNPDLILVESTPPGLSLIVGESALANRMAPTPVALSVTQVLDPIVAYPITITGDNLIDLVVLDTNGANQQVLLITNDGTGTFQSPNVTVITTAPGLVDLAVVDVNQDQVDDLVVLDQTNSQVRVFVQQSGGTFMEVAQAPVGPAAIQVYGTDLNGDGPNDLVSIDSGSNTISVLLGKGSGEFIVPSPARRGLLGRGANNLGIADLDGNGSVDLIATLEPSDSLTFFANQPNSPFEDTGITLNLGAAGGQLLATDLDANDIPDLVAIDSDGSRVTVFPGVGDGSFRGAQNPEAINTGAGPRAIAVADFLNDGLEEIIIAENADNSLSVAQFNNEGTLRTVQQIPLGAGAAPTTLAAFDFNRDNNPGVLCGLSGSNELLVFEHDGTQLVEQTRVSLTGQPVDLATVDFDDDGFLDIVVALDKGATGAIAVLLGQNNGLAAPVEINMPSNAVPRRFAVIDLNSDNKLDLAITATGATNTVFLGFNNSQTGAPAINYAAEPTATFEAESILATDIDRDRIDDLLVADVQNNRVLIYITSGDGTLRLGSPAALSLTGTPRGLASGDINSDGERDIAVSQEQPARVVLFTAAFRDSPPRAISPRDRPDVPILTTVPGQPAQDLTITARAEPYILNTNFGTLDGVEIPQLVGFQLVARNLTIEAGAVVQVVGDEPLFVLVQQEAIINGDIQLDGQDARNAVFSSLGSPGGQPGPGGAPGGQGGGSLTANGLLGQSGFGAGRGFVIGFGSGGGAGYGEIGGSAGGDPTSSGLPYSGPLLFPLFGGSGGAGGAAFDANMDGVVDSDDFGGGGGGGGGGVFRLVTIRLTIGGTISVNGGRGGRGRGDLGRHGGGGSGGAILIQARDRVTFGTTGRLRAQGGNGVVSQISGSNVAATSGAGGVGIIRIETNDPNINLNLGVDRALPAAFVGPYPSGVAQFLRQ